MVKKLSTRGIDGSSNVPAGGAAGQVLKKASAADYDLTWSNDLLGSGGGGTPTGTGREDMHSTSLVQSTSTYAEHHVYIRLKSEIWVSAIKYYCANGGQTEFVLRTAGGTVLGRTTVNVTTLGWYTGTLAQPVSLSRFDYAVVSIHPTTAMNTQRRTNYLYDGTLFKVEAMKLTNFITGSSFSESPGLALLEYNG